MPDEIAKDRALVALVQRAYPVGSVYHVLGHINEQYEDIYTILVDDQSVLQFEVPRSSDPIQMTNCKT